MLRKITGLAALFILISMITPAVFAAGPAAPTTAELLTEIQSLKMRVDELEKKMVKQDMKAISLEHVRDEVKKSLIEYKPGEGMRVEPAGLNIGAGITFVAQGTPDANNAGAGENSIFDASYSADVEIAKEFEDWGFAYLHLEGGENDTIENELEVFSNVNREAADTGSRVEFAEWFYTQFALDKQIAFTLGKMDCGDRVDQNEYANDEKTQFLAHMFRNSPVMEFPPGNALGMDLILAFEPISFIQTELSYFSGDADYDDVFDKNFYSFQFNFRPSEIEALGIDTEQFDGNYRTYFWMNDRNHEKLAKDDESSDKGKILNYGFGFSFDQMVTDAFGLFGRFGWQRPDVLPGDITMVDVTTNPTLEWSWSTGGQVAGKYWKRDDDVLACAIGQIFPSKAWKDASPSDFGAGEGHIEIYYKCQLFKWLAISPDFQLIWNPYGVSHSYQGENDTIFVYGTRAQVDF
ncbi:MAG: carbohydrate porin [Candidatus Omnitrophica bacterium]|nr:carbohydrate porin [Candidatus Omnitrophota bacterium]